MCLSDMDIGIIYIAIGQEAVAAQKKAVESLRVCGCHYPFIVLTLDDLYGVDREYLGDAYFSRWAKINLDSLSPYQMTIYLDADTEVRGDLTPLISPLEDGFDFVISPSSRQGHDVMGHIKNQEKSVTLTELGYTPLALQAGVFSFRKSSRTLFLFYAWRNQWARFRGADQGAILRALRRVPLKVWLLGKDFNNGDVIRHHFGRIRQKAL